MNGKEQIDWELLRADSRARQGFYKALQAEAERAFRSGADLPVVPPNHELTFVDGFLMWNGRPVWWSGSSRPTTASGELGRAGFVNPGALAHGTPLPSRSSGRSGLRHWFRRRLRWAALGEATR